jgi:hypothetical protein
MQVIFLISEIFFILLFGRNLNFNFIYRKITNIFNTMQVIFYEN